MCNWWNLKIVDMLERNVCIHSSVIVHTVTRQLSNMYTEYKRASDRDDWLSEHTKIKSGMWIFTSDIHRNNIKLDSHVALSANTTVQHGRTL